MDGARCSGCTQQATGASTTSSIWLRSPRSVIATVLGAPTTSARLPKESSKEATRALKRQDQRLHHLHPSPRRHGRTAARVVVDGPGGQAGERRWNLRGRLTPQHRLFGEATPNPTPPYDPPAHASASRGRTCPCPPSERPLDKRRGLVMQVGCSGGVAPVMPFCIAWPISAPWLGLSDELCKRS